MISQTRWITAFFVLVLCFLIVDPSATSTLNDYGKYVADSNAASSSEFYNSSLGLAFDGNQAYSDGDFTAYTWANGVLSLTSNDLLFSGSYGNVQRTLNASEMPLLSNPGHDMDETIDVDSDNFRYYEDGLYSAANESLKMSVVKVRSLNYTVSPGCIPAENFGSGNETIDFEYRGKILFFGREYFVKDIDSNTVHIAKGELIEDLRNDSGYAATYQGYDFKVGSLAVGLNDSVNGIYVGVRKPDGSTTQVYVNRTSNAVVGDLEITGVSGNRSGGVDKATIIVYDSSSEIDLLDGEDLEMDGICFAGWQVRWYTEACNAGPCCGIADYAGEPYDVVTEIQVRSTDDFKGVDALDVGENSHFSSNFMFGFKGFLDENLQSSTCSTDELDIVLEGGSYAHSMLLSFTGADNKRYNSIRLDEGPMQKGDLFFLDGSVWEYEKYEKDLGFAGDADDTVDITRAPLISGSKATVTLVRFCDPDDNWFVAPGGAGTLQGNCSEIGNIVLRYVALVDAMDDDQVSNPGAYSNDENITLSPEDLFWAEDSASAEDLIIGFDDSSKMIFYSTEVGDNWLTIEPKMITPGASMANDTYKIDSFGLDANLSLWFVRECNFSGDINALTVYDEDCDLNSDSTGAGSNGNDDDLLAIFENDRGPDFGVVDLTDRGYSEFVTWRHRNNVDLYSSFTNNASANLAAKITGIGDDDQWRLLAPSGTFYRLDWGVDNQITSVNVSRFIGEAKLKRGSAEHELVLDLNKGSSTYSVRLDEGPFLKADWFMLDGKIREFESYTKDLGIPKANDTVTVDIVGVLDGVDRSVTLHRYCDPDDNWFVAPGGVGTIQGNCTMTGDLTFRLIASVDAMDDDQVSNPGAYSNDENVTLPSEDLFWAEDSASAENLVIWFDEGSNTMFYGTDDADKWITVEPKMITPGASATNSTYKIQAQNAWIWAVRECNFSGDINALTVYDGNCDYNNDSFGAGSGGNDDDILIVFESWRGSGYLVADLADRGYLETNTYIFKNNIGLYSNFSDNATANNADKIVELDDDEDTILYTFEGETYIIDWGVDNQITSVSMCAPAKEVDAYYFIGSRADEVNISEVSDQVTATANVSEDLYTGWDVEIVLMTGSNVSSDVNVSIFVDATSYFQNIMGFTVPPSSLARYVTVDTDESLEGNITYFLIRVHYLDSEVTAAGLTESLLRLYRYNETSDTWVLLSTTLDWVFGSGVDTTNNFVWANTSRLSTYGIWEGTTTTTTTKATTTTTYYYGGGGSGGSGGGVSGMAKVLPSCFDGILNCHDGGCEEEADCGGPCSPCMSCSDGIQNQGEEGVDCGGPCQPCLGATTSSTTKARQTTTTLKRIDATTSTTVVTKEVTTTTLQEKAPQQNESFYLVIGAVVVVVAGLAFAVLRK